MLTADGNGVRVSDIKKEYFENEPVKVYNFEVENNHSYFVSGIGVLVHNADGDDYGRGHNAYVIKGTSYDINKLFESQPYVNDSEVKEIMESIKSQGPNSIPPIKVLVYKGEAIVVDGHHRLEAFRRLGYERVPIKYVRQNQLYKETGRTLKEILALKYKK